MLRGKGNKLYCFRIVSFYSTDSIYIAIDNPLAKKETRRNRGLNAHSKDIIMGDNLIGWELKFMQKPRSKRSELLYWENGQEKLVDTQDFLKNKPYDGIIRLHLSESRNVPASGECVHFNFERGGHQVGRKYILGLIARRGQVTPEDEKLPLMYFGNSKIAECVEVQDRVAYEDVPLDLLPLSLCKAKSIDHLKVIIRNRYKTSLPSLSEQDFEKTGVGITKLKVL